MIWIVLGIIATFVFGFWCGKEHTIYKITEKLINQQELREQISKILENTGGWND